MSEIGKLDFSNFAKALEQLTLEELEGLGLVDDVPLKHTLDTEKGPMKTYGGDFVEVNDGSGVHLTSRDVGFGHSFDNPYLNLVKRHH